MRSWIIVAGFLVGGSAIARADEPKPDIAKEAARAVKREFRAAAEKRDKLAHDKGDIFAKIAVHHDYSGEYVMFRDEDVTAFLDLTDPRHPRYSPKAGEDKKAQADALRTAHILVVPNKPREHIGKTFTSDITSEDLEATAKVMRAAEGVAKRLAIKNPRIYIKAAEKVGVGYLHVHVVGERDPAAPLPPALK